MRSCSTLIILNCGRLMASVACTHTPGAVWGKLAHVFTDCLYIFAAALEATLERLALVHARVQVTENFVTLLVSSVAILRMQSGFEPAAKIALVVLKLAAAGLVFFFFGVAKTGPPVVSSLIDTLGSGIFQYAANCVGFVIIGHHYNDGAALSQGVLIDEHLVFRQSFEDVALHGRAGCATTNRANRAKKHSANNSNRENLSHPRNQKACEQRYQTDTSGNSDCASQSGAHRFTHARFFSCNSGDGGEFLCGRVRRKNGDSILRNIQREEFRSTTLCIWSRFEYAYDGLHESSLSTRII